MSRQCRRLPQGLRRHHLHNSCVTLHQGHLLDLLGQGVLLQPSGLRPGRPPTTKRTVSRARLADTRQRRQKVQQRPAVGLASAAAEDDWVVAAGSQGTPLAASPVPHGLGRALHARAAHRRVDVEDNEDVTHGRIPATAGTSGVNRREVPFPPAVQRIVAIGRDGALAAEAVPRA